MQKYYELDNEEEKILHDFDEGVLKSVPNAKKEVERYRGYAKASLDKTRNINIRLSERDLQKIKAKAAKKGLPYQTFVSSILHQYGAE